MTSSTRKINWPVFESCIVSPLRRSRMPRAWGSATCVGHDQLRADRGERVEGLARHPLLARLLELPVARRDVVADGVAGDVLHRPLRGIRRPRRPMTTTSSAS